MFNLKRIIKYVKHLFNIFCNNIDLFPSYMKLILDKFYRLFGYFTEVLFRFRCNQLGHLSDKELQMRLEMIGKLAIGLLILHIGFPIVGFK